MHRTLVQTLSDRARLTPSRLAYVFLGDGERESGRHTYAELDAGARRVARSLSEHLAPRTRAMLLYSDGLDFILSFFGCLYAGVIPVPTYPPLRGKRLSVCARIARNCEAGAVLTTSDQAVALSRALAQDEVLARLPLLTTDDCQPQSDGFDSDAALPLITPGDVAFIQYTSGTTGLPKGVIVTHGNLVDNEQAIARAFEHDAETVFAGWLPLFHDMGLIGNVLQPMHLGIPAVLMPPAAFLQKPVRWLRAISEYRATTSGAPNFAYELCVSRISEAQKAELDLSSWKLAFNGAEPLQPETLQRFSAAFAGCGFRSEAHYPCYGMAESTLFVAGGKRKRLQTLHVDAEALERHRVVLASPRDDGVKQLVACGTTWLDNELKIVDPDTYAEVGPDLVGEIWLSGPSVAAGYWGEPELTRAVFRARTPRSPAREWLRTGDLGFMHDGQLYVTGRLLDLIRIDGRRLYPQDIERTAERCHPHVAKGRVAAFVLAQSTLIVSAEVDFAARSIADSHPLASAIRSAIAAEHAVVPSEVCVLRPATLPITSSGKVRRRACRELYRSDQLIHFGARALLGSGATSVALAAHGGEP